MEHTIRSGSGVRYGSPTLTDSQRKEYFKKIKLAGAMALIMNNGKDIKFTCVDGRKD